MGNSNLCKLFCLCLVCFFPISEAFSSEKNAEMEARLKILHSEQIPVENIDEAALSVFLEKWRLSTSESALKLNRYLSRFDPENNIYVFIIEAWNDSVRQGDNRSKYRYKDRYEQVETSRGQKKSPDVPEKIVLDSVLSSIEKGLSDYAQQKRSIPQSKIEAMQKKLMLKTEPLLRDLEKNLNAMQDKLYKLDYPQAAYVYVDSNVYQRLLAKAFASDANINELSMSLGWENELLKYCSKSQSGRSFGMVRNWFENAQSNPKLKNRFDRLHSDIVLEQFVINSLVDKYQDRLSVLDKKIEEKFKPAPRTLAAQIANGYLKGDKVPGLEHAVSSRNPRGATFMHSKKVPSQHLYEVAYKFTISPGPEGGTSGWGIKKVFIKDTGNGLSFSHVSAEVIKHPQVGPAFRHPYDN